MVRAICQQEHTKTQIVGQKVARIRPQPPQQVIQRGGAGEFVAAGKGGPRTDPLNQVARRHGGEHGGHVGLGGVAGGGVYWAIEDRQEGGLARCCRVVDGGGTVVGGVWHVCMYIFFVYNYIYIFFIVCERYHHTLKTTTE